MKKTTTSQPISFLTERNKRIHDINEKKLQEVHSAFDKAFPMTFSKKAAKRKKKK